MEGIVGVSAEIREAMRMFAAAPSATIMGHGVTSWPRWTWCAAGKPALLTGNLDGPTSAWAGPRQTTYRAPAIWACCRTCFPAIRRSPTRRAGEFAAAWGIDPALMDDRSAPASPRCRIKR